MASPTTEAGTIEPPIIFRAGKKRKAYRQRVEGDDADATPAAPESAGAVVEMASEEDPSISVAEALRLRNARKSRLKGVGFAAQFSTRDEAVEEDVNEERSLVVHKQEEVAPQNPLVGGMTRRFAPQTGMVGDLVNKHM
jgi:hypothetical protein